MRDEGGTSKANTSTPLTTQHERDEGETMEG
jgi:hypothetical protein